MWDVMKLSLWLSIGGLRVLQVGEYFCNGGTVEGLFFGSEIVTVVLRHKQRRYTPYSHAN